VSEAEEDVEERWVIVETTKGIGQIFSYRGRMKTEDLRAWQRGELKGALTLRHTYWLEEDPQGGVGSFVVGRRGDFKNGTGVTHVAAGTVAVIMELRAPDPGVVDTDSGQVFQLGPVRDSKT